MLEKVKERLKMLGYEATEEDSVALTFALQKAEQSIKNECNLQEVPEGLKFVLIERACGEFLLVMNQTGKLAKVFQVEQALKSVKLGDADVTFADSVSSEGKLAGLIDYLLRAGSEDIPCYRRLTW